MEISANVSFTNFTTPRTYFQPEPIVSDQTREIVNVIHQVFILFFALLGVVTNAINMRVFIVQGFSDSNTIGLFFLALADFGGCIFEIAPPLCDIVPYFGLKHAYFLSCAWISLTGHMTHMLMSRITCLITVYIAVERSICVLMPFKVRTIFRPRTTAISITFIYLTVVGAYIPFYLNTWIGSTFHPGSNTTIPVLKQSSQGTIVAYCISLIFNTIVPTVAIIIVAIATGLMIHKLVESRKWRQNASMTKDISHQKPANAKEKREVEVLKMVTIVTVMFIICTIMSHIPGITIALVPGTIPTGINKNLYYVVYAYKVIFDLINSSLNYFFYVRISSKYKAAFKSVFGKSRTQKDPESLSSCMTLSTIGLQ